MEAEQRPEQPAFHSADHQQHAGLARRIDQAQPWVQTQGFGRCARAGARGHEHRYRGPGREAGQQRSQAHSSARSRQAYRMPSRRIAMNMSISTSATIPSFTKTTAHGYMNTISMSKARKRSAIA